MATTCPACLTNGSFTYLEDCLQDVCTNCGYVPTTVDFYEPKSSKDHAESMGLSSALMWANRLSSQQSGLNSALLSRLADARTLQESRSMAYSTHKPAVTNLMKATLDTFGQNALFDAADLLFDQVRAESWRLHDKIASKKVSASPHGGTANEVPGMSSPSLDSSREFTEEPLSKRLPGVRWGDASNLLAAACCFVVMRREGVRVNLDSVAAAARLHPRKVREYLLRFKRLIGDNRIDGIEVRNPDAHIRRPLLFFLHHLRKDGCASLGRSLQRFFRPIAKQCHIDGNHSMWTSRFPDSGMSLVKTPLEAVELTAVDLCCFWWPNRAIQGCDERIAAFVIVVISLEAHLKTQSMQDEMFAISRSAIEFDPIRPDSTPDAHKLAVESFRARYQEILSLVGNVALRMPWVSSTASRSAPEDKRKKGRHARARLDTGQKRNGVTESTKAGSGRRNGHASEPDPSQRDLIVSLIEILQIWKSAPDRYMPTCVPDGGREESSDPPSPSSAPSSTEDVDSTSLETFLSSAKKAQAELVESLESLEDAKKHKDSESRRDWKRDAELYPRLRNRIEAAVLETEHGRAASHHCLDVDVRRHPIDLLTEDLVDSILFSENELDSILRRNDEERAAVEKARIAAGVWDAVDDTKADDAFFHEYQRSIANQMAQQSERTEGSAFASGNEKLKFRDLCDAVGKNDADEEDKQKKERPIKRRKFMRRPRAQEKVAVETISLQDQVEETDWSEDDMEG